jgi:hypothetical protein
MKHLMRGVALAALMAGAAPGVTQAAVVLTSSAGGVSIGIGDDGALDAGVPLTGINLVGVGDALIPGCLCEAWGASFGSTSGAVDRNSGGAFGLITIGASTSGVGTFTTRATIGGALDVTKVWSEKVANGSGALFEARVTLKNTSASTMSNVRFERAMDWDVPPTEFDEVVTIKGTGTTTLLERSTNDGFHNGDPLDGLLNNGRGPGVGLITQDFEDLGPSDHGAMFIFNFGDLLADAEYTFSIYYGAAQSERTALGLLGAVGAELYSFGQQSGDPTFGTPGTFIFAFSGVGGSVVVPPPGDVPAPGTIALFGAALAGLSLVRRRKSA